MATTRKKINAPIVTDVEDETVIEQAEEKILPEEKKSVPAPEEKKTRQKYAVGSVVFISKDAEADLNGFKIFPQYKKYTYTVEAYDEKSGVYSLRKLNLLLKLPEELILAPNEKASSSVARRQF